MFVNGRTGRLKNPKNQIRTSLSNIKLTPPSMKSVFLVSLAHLLAMGFNLLDCPFIVAGTGTYKIGT